MMLCELLRWGAVRHAFGCQPDADELPARATREKVCIALGVLHTSPIVIWPSKMLHLSL